MREILVYDDYEIHKLGAGGGTQYEEVTTEKATSIYVTDVAKPKGKLVPFGRTEQTQLTGKNLLEGIEFGDIRSNTGLDVDSDIIVRSIGYIPYNTTDTYYLSKDGITSIGANLRFYNASKEYIGYAGLSSLGGSNFEITVTTTVEDTTPKYMRFRVAVSTLPIDSKAMVATTSDLTYEQYCGRCTKPFTRISTKYRGCNWK